MSEATMADVLAYAKELRDYAERVRNPDPHNPEYLPYFDPYCPTDKTARNIAGQVGPDKALDMMQARAQEKLAAYEAARAQEAIRLERERRRRERIMEEQRISRMGRSLGSIVDQLLAEAAVLSEVPAAQLGWSARSSEHPSRLLRDQHDDVHRQAQRAVRDTIKAIEGLVFNVRLRRLPTDRTADERLQSDWLGVSAEEVARSDPDFLGNPRAVRERRVELGLLPDDGRKAA